MDNSFDLYMYSMVECIDTLIEITGELLAEMPNKDKATELKDKLDYTASCFDNTFQFYRR